MSTKSSKFQSLVENQACPDFSQRPEFLTPFASYHKCFHSSEFFQNGRSSSHSSHTFSESLRQRALEEYLEIGPSDFDN